MIPWQNLEYNSTERKFLVLSLTPSLTSKQLRTVYNCTSIDLSQILNNGHVGDVGEIVAVAVAVAAGDGLPAAGDSRPTHRQNSWELHASFSSSNIAAETIERIVGLIHKLLWDRIKEVLNIAALIVERLCHSWGHPSWVDSSTHHAVDLVNLLGWNLWWGRTKVGAEIKRFICAWNINRVHNASCIAFTLCSTSLSKLLLDPKLVWVSGRQIMVDGSHSECKEHQLDVIKQWYIIDGHFSYAIEACPAYQIYNFRHCKSKLALLSWSSREQFKKKETLNLCHKYFWRT